MRGFHIAASFLLPAAGVAALVAQTQYESSGFGSPLTADRVKSILGMTELPSGVYIRDSQRAIDNAANNMNTQDPWASAGNHTGYAVWLCEPKAWLGAKRKIAAGRSQPYGEKDVSEDDRLNILRVFVQPDTPEYLGLAEGNNAERVVLESINKAQVAKPVSLKVTTEEFSNLLGMRASFGGLFAIFSMTDVERIRSASPNREFLVTVIRPGRRKNRDFRVKAKHFQRLGD
jgi:hypothetical protein